ncbi:MAG: PDZ domain-containing protein [Anaerolineales bacterium]|nr:PDZ domain-containing protein [Anaerolineales bacterium]
MRHRSGIAVVIALVLTALACTSLPTFIQNAAPTQASRPAIQSVPTFSSPPGVSSINGQVIFDEGDLAGLYTRVNPGVVAIWTFSGIGPDAEDSIPSGQGSGFVVDKAGYIVTNQHVIDGASAIEVDFPSGLKAWAELVGTDPDSDLAVLKVDVPEESLVPLPLGDSDQVQVGELVVAIGNPFGFEGTMTIGIISAKGRTLESINPAPGGSFFSAGDIIQTDAAINPGNSGGPLINMQGEVIGVNRAIRTETFTVGGDAANTGVGFAIPINIVRRVLPSLISVGEYEYPYLGISSLSEWNLRTIELLGLPSNALGAYVTCVTPGSPADEAGLRGAGDCNESGLIGGGDLIIAIDNHAVRRFSELLTYLLNHTEVGQTVTLSVLRNGEYVDVQLTIGARP